MEYTIRAKNTFLNYDEEKPHFMRRSQTDCLNHSSSVLTDTAPIYRVVEKQVDSDAVSQQSDDTTSSSNKELSYKEFAPSFDKSNPRTGSVSTVSTLTDAPFNHSSSSLTAGRLSVCSQSSLNSISRRVSITSLHGSASVLPTTVEEETQQTPLDEFADEHARSQELWTTVMIRNIPCRYSQDELYLEVAEIGFAFNFLYLPPARRSPGNLGYAFVNFVDPTHALAFVEAFTGHAFVCQPKSKKRAEVMFAKLQGFEENVAFYSNVKVTKSKYRPFVDRSFKQ
jgi:hypothetical protein